MSVGRVEQPTSANGVAQDSRTYFSMALDADIEILEDRLVLNGALGVLRDEGSSPAYQGSLGLELTPWDKWILSAVGSFLPRHASTYEGATVLSLPKLGIKSRRADTTYNTDDSNAGLSLSASYNSFGDSKFEYALDATAGWTRYSLAEELVFNPAVTKLLEQAGRSPTPQISGSLNQLKLGAGATAILFQNTDVGVHFAWYFFDRDPSEVGYGRVIRAGGIMAAAGTGLPVAPLRWELRPSLSQRFAPWISATLNGGVGGYFDGGSFLSGGLKLSVKPVRTVKVSLSFALQQDVDPPDSDALLSLYFTLGVTWRF